MTYLLIGLLIGTILGSIAWDVIISIKHNEHIDALIHRHQTDLYYFQLSKTNSDYKTFTAGMDYMAGKLIQHAGDQESKINFQNIAKTIFDDRQVTFDLLHADHKNVTDCLNKHRENDHGHS